LRHALAEIANHLVASDFTPHLMGPFEPLLISVAHPSRTHAVHVAAEPTTDSPTTVAGPTISPV
jgi:hypothetical protein